MLTYEKFFPFKEIRKEQIDALEFAIDGFLAQNKKFVILEMGTGCGKSATAITIARYFQALYEMNHPKVNLGSSYIVTTQKVLQEQYMKDFGKPTGIGDLKLIKSSGAYCCKMFTSNENFVSCGEIQRLLKSGSRAGSVYHMCEQQCTFRDARAEFLESCEGITNYAYFLTTASYTHDMQRRGLLILDEAHNVENAVANFIKISFSNFFYKTVLGVKTPVANAKQEVIFDWLTKIVKPRLRDVIRQESKKLSDDSDSNKALEHAKKLETLKRNFSKIEYFLTIYDKDQWVLDQSKTDKRGERIYEFKPINVGEYCYDILFKHCDRVLILSATILDKALFCDSLGITESDVAFLKIPSPFSPKNHPIHYFPVGSMGSKGIDATLPKMVEVISTILNEHKNDKGIIHCANYKIAKYIQQAINDNRILTHDSDDREDVIKFHTSSNKPTVLLSPSMTEGVDLADDSSRFQIICKIPFPYLGDAAVQKRMKQNARWYDYQTVKQIVQALGRSVRNENDHATSYILDRDWSYFYSRTKTMFPSELSVALL